MKQLRDSSTYKVLHEDEVELLKVQMEAAGEERGRRSEKEAIAVRLLKTGQTVDYVAKATGLKKKVVEGLVKK
jgi:predicted transposase YdaD